MLTEEAKKFFQIAGRKGALAVYKKYGIKHYKAMAKKRWDKARAEKLSVDKSEKAIE